MWLFGRVIVGYVIGWVVVVVCLALSVPGCAAVRDVLDRVGCELAIGCKAPPDTVDDNGDDVSQTVSQR